jgi:hypothetical protein
VCAFDYNTIDTFIHQLQHALVTHILSASFTAPQSAIFDVGPVHMSAYACLVILAFTITTYITFVVSSSVTLHYWYGRSTVGLVLAGAVTTIAVAGLMVWQARPQLEARELGWQVYWLARPHVLEEVVWREALFEMDVEMKEEC